MPVSISPIFPAPRQIEWLSLPPATPSRQLRVHPDTLPLAQRFFAAAACEVRLTPDSAVPPRSIRTGSTQPANLPEAPRLGYILRHAGELQLVAADKPGFYSGLQSLSQLLESHSVLPAFIAVDAPRTALRSFQIDLGRQPESLHELKRLVRQQARYHYNQCQLYLENAIKLPAFEDAANPDGLTTDEFQKLEQFAADLGVELVPSLNLLGHMEHFFRHPKFAKWSEMSHGARHPNQTYAGCLCPELPEAREWIVRVIDEIASLSASPNLMVGMDECWTLGSHPATRAKLAPDGNAGPVFRDWLNFLHANVTRYNKKMWMWEDMLFYHTGALGHIPADIGMQAWHYEHIESVPRYSFQNWRRIDSIGELAAHGHDVMLCCGPAAHELESMQRFAVGHPLAGLLVVQWEGSYVIQEIFAPGRAVASQVLWTGRAPSGIHAAKALARCDDGAAAQLAPILAGVQHDIPQRGGGSNTCPRFWSFPEVASNRIRKSWLLDQWDLAPAGGEAFEVSRYFSDVSFLGTVTDWAREQVALAGRQMLRAGLTQSPVIDDAIEQLHAAIDRAGNLIARATMLQDRYTAGIAPRHMVPVAQSTVATAQELLSSLRAFQKAPSESTWPFAKTSIHLDGLCVDACAHHVVLHVSDDGEKWTKIHDGGARVPPTLEGEFIMSWPLEKAPRFAKLAIGGFASLAVMRLRVETLAGTKMAQRVVAHHGRVRDPEHLLAFDRRITTFNVSEVMPNWLSFDTPIENSVTLEY